MFVLFVLLWYSTAVISLDNNYVSTDFTLRYPYYLFAFDSKSPNLKLHDSLICLKVAVTHIININEISKDKTPYLIQQSIETAAVMGHSSSVCLSKGSDVII